MEKKEIHFYADVSYIHSEEIMNKLYVAYDATEKAIKRDEPIIYTTSIANMGFDLQELFGYDIYIHDQKHQEGYLVTYDMRQYLINCTNRQLRLPHNIEKMWRAGEFYNDNEFGSPELKVDEYVECYNTKDYQHFEGWISEIKDNTIFGSWGTQGFIIGEDVIERAEPAIGNHPWVHMGYGNV